MQLRKYAVTVMDNWTPMRLFWTLDGAIKFANKTGRDYSHIFVWRKTRWIDIGLAVMTSN